MLLVTFAVTFAVSVTFAVTFTVTFPAVDVAVTRVRRTSTISGEIVGKINVVATEIVDIVHEIGRVSETAAVVTVAGATTAACSSCTGVIVLVAVSAISVVPMAITTLHAATVHNASVRLILNDIHIAAATIWTHVTVHTITLLAHSAVLSGHIIHIDMILGSDALRRANLLGRVVYTARN